MSKARWMKPVLIVVAILAAFLVGRGWQRESGSALQGAGEQAAAEKWTCSMHPQIQLPEFGACPICGMDLIALETDGTGATHNSITLSESARKIAEIQTTPVERHDVQTTLRVVGKLEADETRVREISARVAGRIDRLYIDYTGVPVSAGQPLFDLYSPELYSAQEELLQAVRTSEQLAKSGIESTRRSADKTTAAARERLRLWGLTAAQVAEIERRGTPSDHVTFVAPTSGIVLHKDAVEGSYVQTGSHVYAIADLSLLWLKLDVYEADLAKIRVGQSVDFDTDTYPGEIFDGTVAFIDPVLDERSRSVKVRVNVENPDSRLKPGMFARATIRGSAGLEDQAPIVVPVTAPLLTGKRALVYVQDTHDPGRFHAREVSLGIRAGEFYVVHSGLDVGERVVTNGTFKLDSALQILAGESMMTMHGGGGNHGTQTDDEAQKTETPKPTAFSGQVDRLLIPYFALSDGLSHDDYGAAQRSARTMLEHTAGTDPSSLTKETFATWDKTKIPLSQALSSIIAAKSLDLARVHYYEVSKLMIGMVRAYGTTGEFAVYIYHCPMARDDEGADWLQSFSGTENPYFGASMFKCGSQTEVLVAGKERKKADKE